MGIARFRGDAFGNRILGAEEDDRRDDIQEGGLFARARFLQGINMQSDSSTNRCSNHTDEELLLWCPSVLHIRGHFFCSTTVIANYSG